MICFNFSSIFSDPIATEVVKYNYTTNSSSNICSMLLKSSLFEPTCILRFAFLVSSKTSQNQRKVFDIFGCSKETTNIGLIKSSHTASMSTETIQLTENSTSLVETKMYLFCVSIANF